MFLGVDLGTSSIKLLVINESGNVIASAKSEYENFIENEVFSTQKPQDWIDGFCKCLSMLDKNVVSEIKALSVSGQMHGLVCLDEYDKVLYPAILWNDGRSSSEVELLNTKYKSLTNKECDNIALSGFTAPKLMWLKNNEPEVFSKISKIMLPKDYLNYYLTKKFITEVSDASGTLYFNVKERQYSKKVLDLCGIEENQLPKVIESYEKIGTVEEVEQLKKVVVYGGGGDQAIGAIGVGSVKNNDAFISLGTSGVFYTCQENHQHDKDYSLHSFCDATGKYLKMGVILNAAGALAWWSKILDKSVTQIINELEFKKSDVLFYPYLIGERTPINSSTIKARFDNISLASKSSDLSLAVIEGVCFALKRAYLLSGSSAKVIRVTGGGAKSDFWVQLVSNVFNVNVETICVEEGPAYGAAILAYASYNNLSIAEVCDRFIEVKKTFKPNNVEYYNSKFEMFCEKCYGDNNESST